MVANSRFTASLVSLLVLIAVQAAGTAMAAEMLVVEGEALLAKAKANAGKVAVQPMAKFGKGWSGDAHLLWSGGATGAVLDLVIEVPAPAQYAVEIYFTRAPDYGQVSIQIDGKTSPVNFSGFAPRVAPPGPTQLGKFPLQAGARKLSLMIIGKVAESSGYLVGLDQVRFYPAGELSGPGGDSGTSSQTARVGAQAKTPPAPPPPKSGGGGQPSPQPKGPGADCDSTCTGNVSAVFRKTESGQCKLWFRVPCSPYNCDAANGVCRGSCASDGDCAQGSQCDNTTGLCAPSGTSCVDAVTVKSANGQTESCIPYKCRGGVCREQCSAKNDCAAGYSCQIATGRCVQGLTKP